VGFLVWGVAGGWSKAADYSWNLDWGELALAVLVLALFYLAWATGYVVLLEALARRRLHRGRFSSIWARSLLGRYVPGNVLMVAARMVLGREAGVPSQLSLAASVYEQVAMLVVAAVGAAGFVVVAGGGSSQLFWAVLALPLLVVLLDPAVLGRVSAWVLARLGRDTQLVPLTRRQVAPLLAWFALTMGLLALGTGVGTRAVAGSDAGGIAYIGFAFLLAWAASMLLVVFPSGLGAREAIFAALLSRHLPGPAALSLAAASRLLLTAVELVVIAALVARGGRSSSPTWSYASPSS